MISSKKGKTWEEIYDKITVKKFRNSLSRTFEEKLGKEQAGITRKKMSDAFKGKSYEERFANSYRKRTYEEIFGEEKGKEMRRKRSEQNKGKTYEERFGIEEAKRIKEQHSKSMKGVFEGKTKEEIYGEEKARLIKEKISNSLLKTYSGQKGKLLRRKLSISHSGILKPGTSKAMKGVPLEQRLGKEKAEGIRQRWIQLNKSRAISKEDIIKEIKEKYIRYGPFLKSDFHIVMSINDQTARNKFGSLDALAEEAGIRFKIHEHHTTGGIGKNERKASEWYRQQTGNKIIPHFKVATKTKIYTVDWYDVTLNTPIEFDEPHHRYRKIEDEIRENKILEELKCNQFIRIKEEEFLSKINNKSL